jgi:hypothetical protein
LNFTLPALPTASNGLGIGSIVYSGRITAGTLTGGYGNPIQGALCTARNATNSETYNSVSNVAGWCQADESTPAILTSGRPYDVFGSSKAGYQSSINYTVVPL